MSRNAKALLALAGLSIAALSGGCKKPPPQGACCSADGSCSVTIQKACSGSWSVGVCEPNDCPQPPPPPPEEIKLETVAQELKVDPRVQFAEGVSVTVDEIELGKAVVKLADAIARGDDKALAPLLDRRAQGVLTALQTTDEWKDGTKGIEAVRVILVKGGLDLSGATVVAPPPGDDLKAMISAALAGLPEEQRKLVEGMMANLPNDPSILAAMSTQFANAAEQMKAAGVSEEAIEEAKKQLEALGGGGGASDDENAGGSESSTSLGVLLAVQEPNGAYLLGWGAIKAGEHWVFTNAPTNSEVRARASAFDGTEQDGFLAMTLATAVPDAARIDNSKSGGSGGGGSLDGGGGGGGGEGPGEPSAPPASPPVQPPAAPPGSPRGPGRG